MNINEYFGRDYASPPCWDLVADIYGRELGKTVGTFKSDDESIRKIAAAFRIALHNAPKAFKRLDGPAEFAIVLMGSGGRLGLHHCGVFLNGRVLHALSSGVVHQDLASLRDAYPLMEFWGLAE